MANLSKLMEQAGQLQAQMKQAQQELEKIKIRGMAGGDLAMVTLNGKYACHEVKISSILLKESVEVIEDTVKAAINDAVRKTERELNKRMSELASTLKLLDENYSNDADARE